MELEKKSISKENWKRVTSRQSSYMPFKYEYLEGSIGLIYIQEITEPLYKEYNGKKIKLVDKGYYWLQVAPKHKKYWITAMYDDNKELIQYYVDITKENIIMESDKSYFYDLFLDIVELRDGSIFLLDEDELTEALRQRNYK